MATGGGRRNFTVRNVHAQLVFASENNLQGRKSASVLIDFQEAVDGMKLYCADLTDFIHTGDTVTAESVVGEGDTYFAKKVTFDFNPTSRYSKIRAKDSDEYFDGVAIVEHVGQWFAAIVSTDPSVSPVYKELLMPLTALTKDSIPVGKSLSELNLSDLVKPGDVIAYKVPKNPFDEGSREKRKVSSARKIGQRD